MDTRVPYEVLEHPGDLKIRAFGASLAEAFANAGRAMMAFLFGETVVGAAPEARRRIEVTARDRDALLVAWLSELLWHSATEYRAYVPIRVAELSETRLGAEVGLVTAEAVDDIKAVTYHELSIRETDGAFEVTVVCDI
ncbi:MAG: archease [Proteobacteria bacterium]|nr:archease [Pseudomonadota bacterium]